MIEQDGVAGVGTRVEAERLVCEFLVRACGQALCEMALEEDLDPGVKRTALEEIKAILADWQAAKRALVGPSRAVRLRTGQASVRLVG